MQHISIIAHLNAGGLKGRNALARLQSVCGKRGIDYKVYISMYHKHTKKLVQDIALKYKEDANHRLVVVGGDGTLNEAISGLLEKNIKYPICYFPSGTGNDFARSLKITNNEYIFIDNLFTTDITDIDVIVAKDNVNNNKLYSINGLGIGFDALVCTLTKKQDSKLLNKLKLGKFSYLANILEAFKSRETFSINVIYDNKEEVYTKVLLSTFMSKPYFGGGIKINPKKNINDGKISLIFARDVEGLDVIKAISHIFTTEKQFEKVDKLTRINGENFKIIINSQQLIQTDGEVHEMPAVDLDLTIDSYPFRITHKQ